jgi:hypothetical protein
MTLTWFIIVGSAIIWILWDIFAYLKWGNPATESVIINKWMRIAPGLIFLAGYVAGHITWQVHICP